MQQIPIERECSFGVREQSSRFQSDGRLPHSMSIAGFIPVPPEIATVIAGSTFGIAPNPSAAAELCSSTLLTHSFFRASTNHALSFTIFYWKSGGNLQSLFFGIILSWNRLRNSTVMKNSFSKCCIGSEIPFI